MPFSSGTYTLPNPALVTGEIVSATENNATRNDMATAFNLTMLRNGTSTATANLPMGGYKLTGLGAATTSGDALSYGAAATVTTLTATGVLAANGGITVDTSAFIVEDTTGSITTAGNLTFTGTGNRITGDFSNATVANRVAFQTSTTNSTTAIGIPNGTSVASNIRTYNNSDATNAAYAAMSVDGSVAALASGIIGTGTYLPMTFYTGGSERMRIDTSGNVGIGTTNIGAKLTVAGANTAVSSRGNLYVFTTDSATADYGGQIALGGNYSGTTEAPFANLAGRWTGSGTNGYMQFSTLASGTLYERMRIDSSGNVGIGTGSPANRLDAYDSSAKASILAHGYSVIGANAHTNNGCVQVGANGGASLRLDYDGVSGGTGTASIYNTYGGPLRFGTSNTERMRIDSSGNLLVNRTTQFSAGQYSANFPGTTSRGATYNNTDGNTGANFVSFGNNGTVIGTISQNGASNVTYSTSSDYRLKENIQPMQNALSVVQQLNPVTYNWKADGSDGQGFIAHELQAVVPDCVTGEKDAVDADGNPVYQGIDTSFLVATLTKAIQELKAELDATKAEVAALKQGA